MRLDDRVDRDAIDQRMRGKRLHVGGVDRRSERLDAVVIGFDPVAMCGECLFDRVARGRPHDHANVILSATVHSVRECLIEFRQLCDLFRLREWMRPRQQRHGGHERHARQATGTTRGRHIASAEGAGERRASWAH